MEGIIPDEEQDKNDRIQKRRDELSIDNALIKLKKEKAPQVFWNPNTNRMEVLPYNEKVAKKIAGMGSDFIKGTLTGLEHGVKGTATGLTGLLSLAETLGAFALDSTGATDLLGMDSLLDREGVARKWNKDLTSHWGRDKEGNYKNEWIEPVVSGKAMQEEVGFDFREMNQFMGLPIPGGLLGKLKALEKIKITNPNKAGKVDDIFNTMVKLEKDYANKINKINSITDKKEATKALKELNKNRDKAFAQLEKNLSSKTDEIKKTEEAISKANEAANKISNTKIDDIITQIDDINKSYKGAGSVLEYNKKILDIAKQYPHLKNDILELAKVEEGGKIVDVIGEPIKKIINNLGSTTTGKIGDNIKEVSTGLYQSVKDKTGNALDYIATKYPKTTGVLGGTKDVIKTVTDRSSATGNLGGKLNMGETDEEIKNRILGNNKIESIIPDDMPQSEKVDYLSRQGRQIVRDPKTNEVTGYVSLVDNKTIVPVKGANEAIAKIKEGAIGHNKKMFADTNKVIDKTKVDTTKQDAEYRKGFEQRGFSEKEINEILGL